MSSQAHEWQTIWHSLTEVRPASRCPGPNSNLFGSFLNLSLSKLHFRVAYFELVRYLGWTRPLERPLTLWGRFWKNKTLKVMKKPLKVSVLLKCSTVISSFQSLSMASESDWVVDNVAQVWLLQSWGSAVVGHATEDLLPLWRVVLSRNQLIYHYNLSLTFQQKLCNLHCAVTDCVWQDKCNNTCDCGISNVRIPAEGWRRVNWIQWKFNSHAATAVVDALWIFALDSQTGSSDQSLNMFNTMSMTHWQI